MMDEIPMALKWARRPALRPRMPWHAVCGRIIMVSDPNAPCCNVERSSSMVRADVQSGAPEWRSLRRSRIGLVLLLPFMCLGAVAPSTATAAEADLAEVEKLFRTGQYDQCAALA